MLVKGLAGWSSRERSSLLASARFLERTRQNGSRLSQIAAQRPGVFGVCLTAPAGCRAVVVVVVRAGARAIGVRSSSASIEAGAE